MKKRDDIWKYKIKIDLSYLGAIIGKLPIKWRNFRVVEFNCEKYILLYLNKINALTSPDPTSC